MKVTQPSYSHKAHVRVIQTRAVKAKQRIVKAVKTANACRADYAKRCARGVNTLGTTLSRPFKAINRGTKDGFYGRARARAWGRERHVASRVDAALRATLKGDAQTLSPSAMRAWMRAGSAAKHLTQHRIDKYKPCVSRPPLARKFESYTHADLVRMRDMLKATTASPEAFKAFALPHGVSPYVSATVLLSRTITELERELTARANIFRQIVETHAQSGQNIMPVHAHEQQLSIQLANAARLVHGRGTPAENEARSLLKEMSVPELMALSTVFDAAAPQAVKPGRAYRFKEAVGLVGWNREVQRQAVEVSALAGHVRAVTGERLIANTRPAFVQSVLQGADGDAAAAAAMRHALEDGVTKDTPPAAMAA